MYHQFNIQQFYVLPALYLCVLCGSQNKQPLFTYTTLTGFITETQCVYCAVRIGYLSVIQFNISPSVGCQLPVCHRSGQCIWDLWWTERHWEQDFHRILRCCLVSTIPPGLHTNLRFNTVVIGRKSGRIQGTFKERNAI